MSTKELKYSEQRLPDLIESLKSQVKKNMEVINRPVERDLSSDKYVNVCKGRRLGAEYSISGMNEIDKLEQEQGVPKEESYFKEQLPVLIQCLKEMFDINLKVIDIDIDDEDSNDLQDQIEDEIKEIFGKDVSNRIFKAMSGNDKLSEDKFHNVLKARDTARIDNQWVLKKIDELEAILYDKEVEVKKQQSWAKVAAEKKV